MLSVPISAKKPNHLYLCRSPLLAFSFFGCLAEPPGAGSDYYTQDISRNCDGIRAGRDHQCVLVEADDFKPVASGWGGAMAITDGKTRFGFTIPIRVAGSTQTITSPMSIRSSADNSQREHFRKNPVPAFNLCRVAMRPDRALREVLHWRLGTAGWAVTKT